jgi:hypothetical protein
MVSLLWFLALQGNQFSLPCMPQDTEWDLFSRPITCLGHLVISKPKPYIWHVMSACVCVMCLQAHELSGLTPKMCTYPTSCLWGVLELQADALLFTTSYTLTSITRLQKVSLNIYNITPMTFEITRFSTILLWWPVLCLMRWKKWCRNYSIPGMWSDLHGRRGPSRTIPHGVLGMHCTVSHSATSSAACPMGSQTPQSNFPSYTEKVGRWVTITEIEGILSWHHSLMTKIEHTPCQSGGTWMLCILTLDCCLRNRRPIT